MNCPTCGDVEHQPIPEDEAHCECESTQFFAHAKRLGPMESPTYIPCHCGCHS